MRFAARCSGFPPNGWPTYGWFWNSRRSLPRARRNYSNAGYVVVGAIIEQGMGAPWQALIAAAGSQSSWLQSSMRIDLGDARDKFSQLVQAVLDGEQVTIYRHGEPAVDIVRTTQKKREAPKLGTMKGRIKIIDPDWAKALETKEELEAWLDGKL